MTKGLIHWEYKSKFTCTNKITSKYVKQNLTELYSNLTNPVAVRFLS